MEPLKDYQHILFPYAYNILGSAEDAKDAVQDVLYNYLSARKEGLENEKGYLVKSVINQSINIRNKRKRVQYGDVWLPEPIATETADTAINLRDIVSYSMMVLLEQLNARERAVFILKEAFGYSHEEIAETLSITVEHSRKLLSRAKSKVAPSRQPVKLTGRKPVTSELLEKYTNAIRSRDTRVVEHLLSEDIVFFADGGGKVNVVKKVCTGIHDVASLLLYVYEKFDQDLTPVPAVVNHQPALLYYQGDRLVVCQVFGISEDGRIFQINSIVDPDKLRNIGKA